MKTNSMAAPKLNPGEEYIGVTQTDDGPPLHIIRLPGVAGSVSFGEAWEWAESLGGELPTVEEWEHVERVIGDSLPVGAYWSGNLIEAKDRAYVRLIKQNMRGTGRSLRDAKRSAIAIRRVDLGNEPPRSPSEDSSSVLRIENIEGQ